MMYDVSDRMSAYLGLHKTTIGLYMGQHIISAYIIMDGHYNEFKAVVLRALNDTSHAQSVAKAGFEHVAKYHRAVNRVDYIIRTMEVYKSQAKGPYPPETGARFFSRCTPMSPDAL